MAVKLLDALAIFIMAALGIGVLYVLARIGMWIWSNMLQPHLDDAKAVAFAVVCIVTCWVAFVWAYERIEDRHLFRWLRERFKA